MQSKYFTFDGIKSSDIGVLAVRMESKATMPTIGSASIDHKQNKYRITPHVYSVTRENISLSFKIMVFDSCGNIGKWTPEKYREVGKWLIHNEYKPLMSPDDNGKMYYAILTDMTDFEIVNNMGHMEVTFATNSPYAWSLPSIEVYSPIGDNPMILHNASNIVDEYYPDIYLHSYEKQNIKMANLTTGQELVIKNVNKNELLFLDGQNKIITTNVFGKNIFKEFNREWLYLKYGNNLVKIDGNCKIEFKSQFPIF